MSAMSDLFDTLPRPTFILDASGEVLACNRCARSLAWPGGQPPVSLRQLSAALTPTSPEPEREPLAPLLARLTTDPAADARETINLANGTLPGSHGQWFSKVSLWRISAQQFGLDLIESCPTSINDKAAELAGLGFWRWSLQTGVLEWSPMHYKTFGVSAETFTPNYTTFLSLVHRRDRSRVDEFLQAVLQGKQPLAALTFRIERPDGEIRWIRSDTSTQISRAGVIEELIGTALDITASVLAEQTLREKSEQMELAMESSGLIFWDWDLTADTVSFSPQFLEMLGEAPDRDHDSIALWQNSIHPDDRACIADQVSRYLAGETSFYEAKYRLRKKSGDWLWAHSTGKVVERSFNGTPLRMIGTTRDISREQWLEDETAKVLGRFSELMEQFTKPRTLPERPQTVESANPSPRLSPRQHQLLQLIYEGLSSRAIAESLGLEASTIISHRRALLRKLNAHNTAELVKAAIRHKLVEQISPNRG